VAKRFRHLVEPEDHDKNDEQKGDPERTVAGIESAKNKTKQESHRIHLPSPSPPCIAVCRTGNARSVECVRLLAQAGANVNAHDNEANTPLHETFLTDVEEELLKLGADLNARNKDCETMPLIVEYGADLTIRRWRPPKKKGPFDKKLSARQFKDRTSVSSRLRGIEERSHGRHASS
jgi:hypothetical protein